MLSLVLVVVGIVDVDVGVVDASGVTDDVVGDVIVCVMYDVWSMLLLS